MPRSQATPANFAQPPECPACKVPMTLRSGEWGAWWSCPNFPACEMAVGCHQNTTYPLGTPADPETRKLRKKAHDAFDPLWFGPLACMPRIEAYAWLAEKMGLPADQTHFGLFDGQQCQRAIDLVQAFWDEHLRGDKSLGTIGDLMKGRTDGK